MGGGKLQVREKHLEELDQKKRRKRGNLRDSGERRIEGVTKVCTDAMAEKRLRKSHAHASFTSERSE
jgi:hypothetical protein